LALDNISTLPEIPIDEKFPHPIDIRFDAFNIANLSNHSHDEKLWSILYTNQYINKNLKWLNEVELEKVKSKFLAIYHKVKSLFIEIKRSSWEPYFYHLLETAFIRIEESYSENTQKYPADIIDIFYCLLHDIIEDTRKDFSGLRQDFGEEIAFGTHLISKKPFSSYITDPSADKDNYDRVMKTLSLNEYKIGLDEHIIKTDGLNPDDVETHKQLRSKYRKRRSIEHFKKYKSFDTFFKYAKHEAKLLEMDFSDKKLTEICYRIIEVKLCDRLHNLKTMGHIDPETIDRKIWETEEYLLPIAQEINPTMAQKLINEINILREQVPLCDTTAGIVNKVSKKADNVFNST